MNMKKIYKLIAKKHGVSVAEVKREIQAAIDMAYAVPNSPALEVSHKGKPTSEEFISHVVRRVSAEGSDL